MPYADNKWRNAIEFGPLKTVFSISWLVAAGLWSAVVPINAQVNVTQYHNHSSRDGLYIDSAFTQSAAANLTRDLNFSGTVVGNVLTDSSLVPRFTACYITFSGTSGCCSRRSYSEAIGDGWPQ